MRAFDTGATRDDDDGKLDYEGFLSPYALKQYAEYMNRHRVQTDGELRDSDNWQKGIPFRAYMKSLWRHFMEFWTLHRDGMWIYDVEKEKQITDVLCAVIFNAMGYLHEITAPGTRKYKVPQYKEPPPIDPDQAGFHEIPHCQNPLPVQCDNGMENIH